jgi:hypothetical protein
MQHKRVLVACILGDLLLGPVGQSCWLSVEISLVVYLSSWAVRAMHFDNAVIDMTATCLPVHRS